MKNGSKQTGFTSCGRFKKPLDLVYVTKPFLPPLEELHEYLKEIWSSKQLTNMGKFHAEFEKRLSEYLGVPHISLFANGTLALITALQAMKIRGEVITTPFSFPATTHALHWNGITPVFCDIEPDYLTLDPQKIKSAITSKTTAIFPVHVYGNPCKTNAILQIADKYGLKVIYDAAHAFGVKVNGRSLLNSGDLSVLSFHATKVFTTFEGGAIICHNADMKKRIDRFKNFGFAGETTVAGPGINAKMNEFQAVLGLLQLKHHNKNIIMREAVAEKYRRELQKVKGVSFLGKPENTEPNYSYFPIFINEKEYGVSRDRLYEKLKRRNIYARRYFYPLISRFTPYRRLPSAKPKNLPVAEQKAGQVICLPIYPGLTTETQNRIIQVIQGTAGIPGAAE